jgi:16S rRNA processing protein RimM
VETRLTSAGTIVKVHGLHGEMVVNPTVPSPEALENVGVFVLEDDKGFRQPGRVERAKVIRKSGRYSFFVKFVHIDSREAAEPFVGTELFLDALTAKRVLPKAAPSWSDVIGFRAVDEANGFEGVVRDVLTGTAQPLLEIQAPARVLLVPAVDMYVSGVAVRKKLVTLQNTSILLEI